MFDMLWHKLNNLSKFEYRKNPSRDLRLGIMIMWSTAKESEGPPIRAPKDLSKVSEQNTEQVLTNCTIVDSDVTFQ